MTTKQTTMTPDITGMTEQQMMQVYAQVWHDKNVEHEYLNWQIISHIGQSGLQRVFAATWAIVKEHDYPTFASFNGQ